MSNAAERSVESQACSELTGQAGEQPSSIQLGGAPTFGLPVATTWAVQTAACGVALLAHALALYLLIRAPDDRLAGAAGEQLDAITVTIVSSNVLESRVLDRSRPSAPVAAAAVETDEGTPDSTPARAAELREDKKDEQQEQERAVKEPAPAVEAMLEVPRKTERQRPQEPAAPAAGGASARGDAPVDAITAAPAAASAGAVREYARYVAQALGKTKPKAVGGNGTVKVKFTIGGDGRLVFASVTKSSGSTQLDDRALDAVRRASFPQPPPGMTNTQLTFEIPYYFR